MVMLSTRLTGSSASMISVSRRSPRSTGVCAPLAVEVGVEERPAGVRIGEVGVLEGGGHLVVRPVEERGLVGIGARPRRVAQRRVPGVAGEHLVGALARLNDLQRLGHLLGRAGRRRPRRGETIGSLIASTAPSSAGSIRPVSMWIRWWSVSNSRAMMSGVAKLVALAVPDVVEADGERRQAILAGVGEQRDDQT